MLRGGVEGRRSFASDNSSTTRRSTSTFGESLDFNVEDTNASRQSTSTDTASHMGDKNEVATGKDFLELFSHTKAGSLSNEKPAQAPVTQTLSAPNSPVAKRVVISPGSRKRKIFDFEDYQLYQEQQRKEQSKAQSRLFDVSSIAATKRESSDALDAQALFQQRETLNRHKLSRSHPFISKTVSPRGFAFGDAPMIEQDDRSMPFHFGNDASPPPMFGGTKSQPGSSRSLEPNLLRQNSFPRAKTNAPSAELSLLGFEFQDASSVRGSKKPRRSLVSASIDHSQISTRENSQAQTSEPQPEVDPEDDIIFALGAMSTDNNVSTLKPTELKLWQEKLHNRLSASAKKLSRKIKQKFKSNKRT